MSDIVTEDDLSAVAGEYVLGTLDPSERSRANMLLDVDQRFRGLVRVWEMRFGELHLMVEPVAPDGQVWESIRETLGIGPREPAPPPAPAVARAEAPAVGKPEASKSAEVKAPESKPAEVKAVDLEPDEDGADQDAPEAETDLFEPDDVRPKRELSDLIEEVEKYTETMKGESRASPPPPGRATAEGTKPKLEPATTEATARKADPATAETMAHKLEFATAEASLESELTTAEKTTPGSKPDQEESAKVQRMLRDAAARDAAAAALVAVEQAREQLRRRPAGTQPDTWRAVALVMTCIAAGLTSLIAAWRFVPDRLPGPLHPTAVLNITDAPERSPAPHGTEFEE